MTHNKTSLNQRSHPSIWQHTFIHTWLYTYTWIQVDSQLSQILVWIKFWETCGRKQEEKVTRCDLRNPTPGPPRNCKINVDNPKALFELYYILVSFSGKHGDAYKHTYIHTYTHIYIYLCRDIYIHIYIFPHIYTSIHASMHIYINIFSYSATVKKYHNQGGTLKLYVGAMLLVCCYYAASMFASRLHYATGFLVATHNAACASNTSLDKFSTSKNRA